jgi:Amt family ammonium transporter
METGEVLNLRLAGTNGLVGLAGGALLAQLYSWSATGRFDPLMGSRGALAGLVAISAGAPLVPTWAALIIGCIAGLVLPVAIYSIEHLLRFEDTTAAIAGYLLPGLWGLVAVAIFADGRWGQGWNGVAGLSGQGVTGLIAASGLKADSGQMSAQVWGSIALFALGFLVPWGAFRILTGLARLLRTGTEIASPADMQSANALNPSSQRHSTPSGLDGVAHVDDGH